MNTTICRSPFRALTQGAAVAALILSANGAEKPAATPTLPPPTQSTLAASTGPGNAPAAAPAGPMKILALEVAHPVIPALIRQPDNPVVGLRVRAEGTLSPRQLVGMKVTLAGTTRPQDVRRVRVLKGGPTGPTGEERFGQEAPPHGELAFRDHQPLASGDNWFWVCVELQNTADIRGRIGATVQTVEFDDGSVRPLQPVSPVVSQRVGWALRMHGDDRSKAYRIPGLATTTNGTLIAVYDIRHRGGGDLPADIDIGMSRSPDGGQSWEPMRVIMDLGDDPKWRYDGIGDPAVLVDTANNRIWVAALWSHGNRGWGGSGKGLKPEETGQLMLAHSDDDGRTWSKPINITGQVKDPAWYLVLQGPGRGITLKDGTLVFAAQFQAGDAQRTPYSTLISSKDHGQTWAAGTGVKSSTTEAQVVELGDGSLMINCRDNRGGARTIATTRDLGRTWTLHPTDRKALNEPVCMASLLRIEHPRFGPLLLFSNPNTPLPGVPRGRNNMTLKVSTDEGMTWPEARHTLYDSRPCAGYSCLSPIGQDHVGVLYEGANEIYFLKLPIGELMGSP